MMRRKNHRGHAVLLTLSILLLMAATAAVHTATSQVSSTTERASLTLVPNEGTAFPGDSLVVDVALDSSGQPIAGVDLIVTFDVTYLEATAITLGTDLSSLQQFLPQDATGAFDESAVLSPSGTTGQLRFGAVNYSSSPSPTILDSFTGTINPVASITFRVKETAPTGSSTVVGFHYTGDGQTGDSNVLRDPEGGSAVDILADTNVSQSRFQVNIAADDTTLPIVSIIQPQDGETVRKRGNVSIEAQASDSSGVAVIVLAIDGVTVLECLDTTTCQYNWHVNDVAAGEHTITATATDASSNGNAATHTITVTKP